MATIDALSLQSRVKLSDGYDIPILGLGTYEMDGRETYKAVTYALEVGYRLIDCAEWQELCSSRIPVLNCPKVLQ